MSDFLKYLLTSIVIMLVSFFYLTPVHADISEDFSNSTMVGYVMDGEATSIIENISILEPSGSILGLDITFIRAKIFSKDGRDIVDEQWVMADIGISDTFKVSGRKLDEPFDLSAIGIEYDSVRHWLGPDAPPVYIGFYFIEGGKYMYTAYGKVYLNKLFGESFNGYSVNFDTTLGMETPFNRDWLDGKIALRKDTDPSGNSYIEAFVFNNAGFTYVGGGIGRKF